jgi:hypothetical protein
MNMVFDDVTENGSDEVAVCFADWDIFPANISSSNYT